MPAYTILIADDNADFSKMLRSYLGKLGFKIFYASDGLQAKEQAEKHKPDLIILDFEMPFATGAVVDKRLQHSLDTRITPVIFISGLSPDAVRKTLPNRPNTRFLSKPLDLEILVTSIHELLQNPSPNQKVKIDLEAT